MLNIDYITKGRGKKFLAASLFALSAYVIIVVAEPLIFGNHFGLSSHIAGEDVSWKSSDEAKEILEKKWLEYKRSEINIAGTDVVATTTISSIKIDETIKEALDVEQSGYFSLSKYFYQNHPVDVTYNNDGLSSVLLQKYDDIAVAPEDAKIVSLETGAITKEKNGQRLMLAESHEKILSDLQFLPENIDLVVVGQPPLLTAEKAQKLFEQVKISLNKSIIITGSGSNYDILPNELQSWMNIRTASANTLVTKYSILPSEKSEYYYLDAEKVQKYVASIGDRVNKKAANLILANEDGKMVVSTASVVGQKLDAQKATIDIQEAAANDHVVKLEIAKVNPDIREDNLAELGIVGLLAEGWSDWAGSPVNRIHNIKTGASKFDGLMIKPDEDFSFNKALGAVDASTGYLPELVILADKTVPEFGGGLCQVSSTAYRAALNSGLPILERHAHAYPVSYYKPYGVDATIYLPSPDMRFTNDTGKYIYVQTKIIGTKLYFDFFGTKKDVNIKFSGNPDANGAVDTVEKVASTLTEQDARGPKSFTATFYRHIYDITGKLLDNDKFTSKYDSPDKYPH
ncbi:MAG: VanW family protein [bacterium]